MNRRDLGKTLAAGVSLLLSRGTKDSAKKADSLPSCPVCHGSMCVRSWRQPNIWHTVPLNVTGIVCKNPECSQSAEYQRQMAERLCQAEHRAMWGGG